MYQLIVHRKAEDLILSLKPLLLQQMLPSQKRECVTQIMHLDLEKETKRKAATDSDTHR